MTHARSTTRKLIFIALVVVMLTMTVGSGIASAGSPKDDHAGKPTEMKGMWWGPLCKYTVRPGDTLTGIARRFGTTVANLVKLNGIAHPNLIRSGRHLLVPCGAPPKPPKDGCFYRVKPGDTLSRIALRFHTAVGHLAAMNGIANPNKIFAGQWLRVPCWDP